MGDEADDILSSFGLTEEQKREYATVKDRFEKYFVKKRNSIFERAKFNNRWTVSLLRYTVYQNTVIMVH